MIGGEGKDRGRVERQRKERGEDGEGERGR